MSGKDLFHAIGDARRRALLELLGERPRTVGELAAELGIAQPSVSQHITLLRELDLVSTSRRGTATVVELTAAPLRDVAAWCLDLADRRS
ncbi:ArsR/SmtB family transcription factor [Ruicaihuangia caeni]|uniref:Metalloregulator ArsR/SmtB family transcription factor n=1 Tax=Ruicaihuangia caeni TaxID=3042517 RepID=A0AAW6T3J6_9MICO|nr:metalloregulator ArsR/SmtB family transcription factor [Klugiella sp. YN-L-19]MDI2097666.1 metalloregulator ArsR/SmtB family transcription factor [Klugiella sp. YN-L-19]